MKFAHSLKFNAVPEWQDNYLSYPTLKKIIYKLQQDQVDHEKTDEINSTTVTDLVEEFKFRRKEEEKLKVEAKANSPYQAYNSSKGAFKLLHRFKKSNLAPIKDESDLEKNVDSANTSIMGSNMDSNVDSTVFDSSLKLDSVRENTRNANPSVESFAMDSEENSSVLSFESSSSSHYSDPNSDSFDPLKVFTKQLLIELQKINNFYNSKEDAVFQDYNNVVKDLEANNVHIDDVFRFTQAYLHENPDVFNNNEHHQYNIRSTLSRTTTNALVFDHINNIDNEKGGKIVTEEVDEDDDDDDEDVVSPNSALLSHTDFNVEEQVKITLRRRSVVVFIALSELKSFIELNKIGFTKICKKFDKTCNYKIKSDFIDYFLPNNSKVFLPETIGNLDIMLDHVVKIYAFLSGRLNEKTTRQDLDNVRIDLKSHLRDHIVWERNTVWKDLLSLEKKSYNLNLDANIAQGNKMGDESYAQYDMMHIKVSRFNLPLSVFGRDHISIPTAFLTWQIVKLLVTIIVFAILMSVKTFNDKQQANCLAVLVASAMMWASEALPLYVTSMLVPLLVVSCKVLKDTHTNGPMAAADAANYILSQMWNSVIMILIGGFTLAAALSKYNVAKILSSYILAFAGTKPRNVLLAIMAVSLFLAMWISNVAAPVLCYSLIQPVLRTLPTESPFAQALVLGIALASNVAGMASPIASPQNVIALEYMDPNPGWGKWFAIALPVAIISMLGIWLELVFTFDISSAKLKAYKPIKDRFTVKQMYVSAVVVATILCWCLMTKIEGTFGQAGIISIIPIVLFFGTGLLKADDLNNFPWAIVWLAMGGLALGKAVTSSGLLKTIAMALQQKIMDFNAFVILLIFGLLILVVATFVSHTVAALIIIPLVKEVGDSLPTPHPLLLVMGAAMIASAAMGLPTSGFPNVTAISMTDEVGKPYLTVNTFITRGVPASIIAYIVVITVGYGIMTALKF